ncbi:MAG: CBS domain-containing protein [Neisseriaceae bacterium]|nr:CBS domain-containing protein [Neisseriaceae bacterium]MBR3425083.1 CBS domain-containing protein [Neisseriaceae bacterium]
MDADESKPSFFERLFHRIVSDAPESADEILRLLHSAEENGVVDENTADLLEKVLAFADLEVRDVMISRAQMDVVKMDDAPEKIIDYVIDTAHSRLPVIGGDRDEVLGILHAKDLLRFCRHPERVDFATLMRPATFVPESKPLNILLKDFRNQHIHLAMVVDEYGGISGLITFEDILEAIVGEIEDEFDSDETQNILPIDGRRFRVNAVTEIAEFNEFFHTDFSDEEVETVGGLVLAELDRLPEKGEKIIIDGWQFSVARVDHRRLHILIVQKVGKE